MWHCSASGTVISLPKHRFENLDATMCEGRLLLGTIPLSLLFRSPFKGTGVGFLKQRTFNKAFVTFDKMWAILCDLLILLSKYK